MEYKILTRKNYILDAGLLQKGTTDVVVPFENMEVEVTSNFVLGDKVTLATEEQMEFLVNQGIAGSHKIIAGEFEVADEVEAQAALATYANGGDLIFTNGRIFNNGNATPGEVLFLIPKTGSTFKAEEIIVGSKKELIALSTENTFGLQLTTLETRVKANEDDKVNLVDFTPVKDQVDLNTLAIGTNSSDIVALNNDMATVQGDVTNNEKEISAINNRIGLINDKDNTQDTRIEALELAESLDDKVWTGSLNGASNSLSTLVDQNGDTFDFITGKKLELTFESPVDTEEDSKIVTVDSPNWASYSVGTLNFGAKISSAGLLTLAKLSGGGAGAQVTDVNLIEMLEAKSTPSISISYTKNESDAKYATKTALDVVDKKVDAIDFSGKQDSIDNSLLTSTKSVVGAINELDGKIKINDPLVARLGGLKTSDGDDLSTTTEALVTDKTITDRGYMTKAEVDKAISDALSTIMDVTFDDASTGQFKLGK